MGGKGGCRVRENAHGVRNRLCRIAEQRRRGHGLNLARRKGKQARRKTRAGGGACAKTWRPLRQVSDMSPLEEIAAPRETRRKKV